ncbi:MAG: hypothetical protein J6T35_05935 [Bacteroidales bacterium]|nr:hypothetical protein [Bacteroidales bacterium]
MNFEDLIPIGICVVLPIVIVWLNTRAKMNETNKKTEIMLKAIESGATIDTGFFKAQQSQQKTIKEKLLARLTGATITTLLGVVGLLGGLFYCNHYGWDMNNSPLPTLPFLGGILLAVGISLFIVYFVGKRMLAKEIEDEERKLQQ